MSHAVWCQVCPRPAVCRECGTDYGDSTEYDLKLYDEVLVYGQQDVLDVASGAVRELVPSLFGPGRPSWSADGKTLAFAAVKQYSQRFREGTSQILAVDVATGEQTFHAPGRQYQRHAAPGVLPGDLFADAASRRFGIGSFADLRTPGRSSFLTPAGRALEPPPPPRSGC